MFDRCLLIFIAVMSFLTLMYSMESSQYIYQMFKNQTKQTELDNWFEHNDDILKYNDENHLPNGVLGE